MKFYILDISGSPRNAITVYLCNFLIKCKLFSPFAAGYYKIWKKERKVISFKNCKLKCFFLPNISSPPPPNIGPSNFSFVRIYTQGVWTGFYGIYEIIISIPWRIDWKNSQQHTAKQIADSTNGIVFLPIFFEFLPKSFLKHTLLQRTLDF